MELDKDPSSKKTAPITPSVGFDSPCAVLGWDIGGAHLKVVLLDPTGHPVQALCYPFALWKQPDKLAACLAALACRFPPAAIWAVTMTGELCDCFPTKRAGVAAILNAVLQAAGSAAVWVWSTTGRFVTPEMACQDPLRVAAANWHALATAAASRWAPEGPALLWDTGSTTTDLIPLLNGRPCPTGWTDWERLRTGELIYRGIRRTPLCVLMPQQTCAEWFATTLDLFLILGDLPADTHDTDTADGRPATVPDAYARLARLIGADSETVHPDFLHRLATQLTQRLEQELADAFLQVCQQPAFAQHPQTILLSGSGEFLARRVCQRLIERLPACPRLVSLGQCMGPTLSTTAPAWAVATLAATSPLVSS
ncbi:MAG: hydantoinase/oxoprolinase family protein [Thermogemmata sp.]|nr:hydantoinase/oxoprolinase family protein [Thermogemmata sp.]